MTSSFFNGHGLSLGRAKLVSTNDRPSYSSIIFRLFPSGGEKKKMRRILHEPVGEVLQGMPVEIFGQKLQDLIRLCLTSGRI